MSIKERLFEGLYRKGCKLFRLNKCDAYFAVDSCFPSVIEYVEGLESKLEGKRAECIEATKLCLSYYEQLMKEEGKVQEYHGWLKEATDALREVLEENKKLRGLVK